jgi:hypothetical protein
MNGMRWFAGAMLGAALLVSAAPAQQRYRIGQEVEFNVRGEWQKGRVLRVMPDGKSLQVRAIINNRPQAGVVPLEDVRPVGGEAPANKTAAPPPVVRTWSDSSGKFRIEAVYVGQEGDAVKLRKSDGAEISVPLARLSKEDQEYVALRAAAGDAAKGFQVGDAVEVHWRQLKWYPAVIRQVDGDRYLVHYDDFSDAFDEWFNLAEIRPRGATSNVASPAAAPAAPKPAASRATYLDVPSVACDVTKSTPIPIDAKGAAPAALAPDAAPAATMPEGGFAVRKLEFFEKVEGVLPAKIESGWLLVSFVDAPPSNASTTFATYDITGKPLGEARFTGAHRLLAGGGGWLITSGTDHDPQWHVWKWPQADQPPAPGYRLNIVTDESSVFGKQISRAWVHGDLAVLQTEGKRVILWNLSQQRIEASWEGYKAAVSGGGKYLAVQVDSGIAIFELATRKQLGFWGLGSISVSALEFSPQGASLACLLQNDLKVLDLKTGKLRFDNALPQGAGSTTHGPPVWCNEDHVIIGRQYLVDLNAGFVVWKYVAQASVFGVPEMRSAGGKVCYLADRYGSGSAHIRCLTLPHETVKAAVGGSDPREIYALSPGGAVSLQVNAGAEAGAIRQALEQRIAANGWKLAAESPVRIVVTLKAGESRTESFREGLGGTGAATSVTFRPTISEVDVQVNGESAWSTATETALPIILTSRAGQSMQDAAREYEKPDLGFFAKLPLPRQIVKPKYREGLGTSQLTGAGVVDGGR